MQMYVEFRFGTVSTYKRKLLFRFYRIQNKQRAYSNFDSHFDFTDILLALSIRDIYTKFISSILSRSMIVIILNGVSHYYYYNYYSIYLLFVDGFVQS